jgi:hypothetical protein
MLYGDVAACHRAECVLCAVQNATVTAFCTAHRETTLFINILFLSDTRRKTNCVN